MHKERYISKFLIRDASGFVSDLQREFGERRQELLALRHERQSQYDQGTLPNFLKETEAVRNDSSWKVAEPPGDLRKRWVEITGPASARKMMINALNSGADAYMADFEDSESPTWKNLCDGQKNLYDAVRGTIAYVDDKTKKEYAVHEEVATLFIRPRGWHLDEKHMLFDGTPMSASLFDFGIFFYHNAKELIDNGSGPYFYLPKMQSHLEARLWNDVFNAAQDALGIPRGTIRATALIETLPAAFEMEEILYELRDHSAGLNCGRWDYIFSFIKTLQAHPDFVLPDRSQVTMDKHFLKSYVNLLIQTCHKRGAYAMGGMAAQIPLKDPVKNAEAIAKVIADKEREVAAGHDGTWVAHPGLVPVARGVFEKGVQTENQLHRMLSDVDVTAQDLLTVPTGMQTNEGLRKNISVGIQYLEAWLSGTGCVPLYNLMEDAATAEISRAQIWQWCRHGTTLDDGTEVTSSYIGETMDNILKEIKNEVGSRWDAESYEKAASIFYEMCTADECPDFLTSMAYKNL